jgi:hypothetical protein
LCDEIFGEHQAIVCRTRRFEITPVRAILFYDYERRFACHPLRRQRAIVT